MDFVFYSGIGIKVCSPGSSVVKNPLAMTETEVRSLVGEDPEKKIATYYRVLVWEEGRTHGHHINRRTWPGTVHGVAKEWDTTERLNNKCIKVGGGIISIFFLIPASVIRPFGFIDIAFILHSPRKIPWTEEPGRLQSMGRSESDTTERLHFHFSLSCIGKGNGNPLQCSCLENPRDRRAWWAAFSGRTESDTTEVT